MKSLRLALTLSFIGLSLSAQAASFPLYNLSILLPLPRQSIDENRGLGKETCDRPLLETGLFSELPNLLQIPNSVEEQYQTLRIVGIRFDLAEEEVRLVAQPLYSFQATNGTKWGADDAALHLFYKMSREEILATQEQLAKSYPNLEQTQLGIHPGIMGLSTRTPITKLLCDIAKLELFKVTFMSVRGNRVVWNFGGFHVTQDPQGARIRGADVSIANARGVFMDEGDSDMSVQRVSRFQGAINAGVLPSIVGGDNMTALFAIRGRVPSEAVEGIRNSVDRIENPRLNNPHTVDCLSCHATESARINLEDQHNSRGSSNAFPTPQGYAVDSSIDRATLRNTVNFRSFGYLDTKASVSRRVLNETIEMQSTATILQVLSKH